MLLTEWIDLSWDSVVTGKGLDEVDKFYSLVSYSSSSGRVLPLVYRRPDYCLLI